MRAGLALSFVLALAAAPALAADAVPPEAQPAIDAVKGMLKESLCHANQCRFKPIFRVIC